MSADDPRPSDADDPKPVGVCVLRSEPIDHSRLYSVTVTVDVMNTADRQSHRSRDAGEVLRIVADFLRESL